MIQFRNDNFLVTLEWPHNQFSGETYTVATTPEAVHTMFTTNTSVQLVMFYDTLYNMTVTATLCGHRNTTNFTLYYGENGLMYTHSMNIKYSVSFVGYYVH